jgi:hypothetical protein
MPEVFQSAGPIAAIRNDLRSVGSRSVQDIDPDLIEDTGLKDRIGALDDDVADLRDSISRHGQQVPSFSAAPKLSGRYQVVYGRRRLAAIRGLGTPGQGTDPHPVRRRGGAGAGTGEQPAQGPLLHRKGALCRRSGRGGL